jgi:hypothetical protein
MKLFLLLIAIGGTLAVFATTKRGREIARRIGLRRWVPGAAPSEDVAFLLDACRGDRREVERRLEIERSRLPALDEADHYRRAIRRVLAERERDREGEPESDRERAPGDP